MIKEGKAYLDNTDVDTMRKNRGAGIESVSRNATPEENLEIF
jgi:glutamyl-tRNA synthetase